MSEPIFVEKQALLGQVRAGYAQFETLLSGLSEEQMTTPDVNGTWSVKDNIAHLAFWHEDLRQGLQGVATGKQPVPERELPGTEDEQNELVYQENKDRALADVLADFRASYQRVLASVEALDDESLNKPFPWTTNTHPVWAYVRGNTFGHYEEHGEIIRRWLAERV